MSEIRHSILSAILATPPLPESLRGLMALADRPDDPTAALDLFSREPRLPGQVLALVETHHFGASEGERELAQAASRMGIPRLASLALVAYATPRIGQALPGYRLQPGKLLDHALCSALAADCLADRLGLKRPTYAFACGFLANIGKTLLDQALAIHGDDILGLACSRLCTFDRAEETLLGIDHSEAGALLLEHWEVPNALAEVIHWHLHPDEHTGNDATLDLVHMGDALAKLTGVGLGIDGMYYQPSVYVAERLRLTPEIVDTVMAEAMDRRIRLMPLFAAIARAALS